MAADSRKMVVVTLLVIAFLSYSSYIYYRLPVNKYAVDPNAEDGKMVWQKYNCNACHQIYGLGGYLGPDLTNIYSLKGADYIKPLVNFGPRTMPAFHLSDIELKDLIAYLKSVDASGKSDPRTFTIHSNGTIAQ